MYISKEDLKKLLKKTFKKGQIDQLVRGRPYTENNYYLSRRAQLKGGVGPVVQQYLKRDKR